MSETSQLRVIERIVWAGLCLVVAAVGIVFFLGDGDEPGAGNEAMPVYSRVSDFRLTNQFNVPFEAADLRGRFWIGDIIFTRCPGPCVTLTRNMSNLQETLPSDWNIGFFSLTADPEFDRPEVLRRYGLRFGADMDRWQFLTGTKKEINRLAIEDLLLVVADKDESDRQSPEDLFIHSTRFVLIDPRGQMRGFYDGSRPESLAEIREDLEALMGDGVGESVLNGTDGGSSGKEPAL